MRAVQFLSNVQVMAFGALAILAILEWRRRRGEAAGWVAATFGTVGGILVAAKFLPRDGSGAATMLWPSKILLAILIMFPSFLYRFMASFRPPGRWLRVSAPC